MPSPPVPTLGFGRLLLAMATFVVAGMPLVFFLWTVLNDVLAGHLEPRRLLLAVPVLLLFMLLLVALARAVKRWEARHLE